MLGACFYSAPDYSGTAFKCDDQHPCLDGQQCIAGVCHGTGVGSNADGVKCGGSLVCPVGMACCADPIAAPKCIPATGSCIYFSASCDGIEDCATGQVCCMAGQSAACGSPSCPVVLCTDASDCPSAAPACCFPSANLPWGECETGPC